jgi:[ribosomal protein S18]-alanine N-acetyltransferase
LRDHIGTYDHPECQFPGHFPRKVADSKLYGQPLDYEGAVREITQNSFYFVKRGSAVVGTVAFRRTAKRSFYISNVAVLPEFRRQGIAKSAVLFVLGKCVGAQRVELAVHPENQIALKLYMSLGFVIESCKENFFGDGEPRLILVLLKKPGRRKG